MLIEDKLKEVQKDLQKEGIDGWLFYDFRGSNDLACTFLNVSTNFLTRRFFYWLPAKGDPVRIVHPVEPHVLSHLPGLEERYMSWKHLEDILEKILKGAKKIAMEYSPRNAIPYVSKVDAGTMDVVKGLGIQVVSSAGLLQKYESVWDDFQEKSHFAAANMLDKTMEEAWKFIGRALMENRCLTERDVQLFILKELHDAGFTTEGEPIVSVNEHAADPHYCCTQEHHSPIKKGDFILLDVWCRQNVPGAVYADICRCGVADIKPSLRQIEIFSIVKEAQQAATKLVQERFAQNKPLMGWEVDDAARHVIEKAGYGPYFTHRTGHNIHTRDHGNGAHIDNLETQDRRYLIPRTCFSIEPGIYLPGEFGVRLEYDIYIDRQGKVHITGGVQTELTCALAFAHH